jgi:hypothetical protein
MGYVRRLKPRQKARVKALRASKGVPAAIRLAKRAGESVDPHGLRQVLRPRVGQRPAFRFSPG